MESSLRRIRIISCENSEIALLSEPLGLCAPVILYILSRIKPLCNAYGVYVTHHGMLSCSLTCKVNGSILDPRSLPLMSMPRELFHMPSAKIFVVHEFCDASEVGCGAFVFTEGLVMA